MPKRSCVLLHSVEDVEDTGPFALLVEVLASEVHHGVLVVCLVLIGELWLSSGSSGLRVDDVRKWRSLL